MKKDEFSKQSEKAFFGRRHRVSHDASKIRGDDGARRIERVRNVSLRDIDTF